MERKSGERAFCRAYLGSMDAQRAAHSAGAEDGFALLRKKSVREALARMRQSGGPCREDVLRRLGEIAFARANDAVKLALGAELTAREIDALELGALELGALAEFQAQCYAKGTAKTKVPSFHGEKAGLAFDFCKNVKGHEYDDAAFFEAVGVLGKEMGFSWGGDWKDFPDRPHFQWDEGGKYSAAMVRAGQYPPKMPRWEEEAAMTQEKFNEMLHKYLAGISKLPPSDWSKEARAWAEAEGLILGGEHGEKSYQMFVTREQMAVFLHRLANKS